MVCCCSPQFSKILLSVADLRTTKVFAKQDWYKCLPCTRSSIKLQTAPYISRKKYLLSVLRNRNSLGNLEVLRRRMEETYFGFHRAGQMRKTALFGVTISQKEFILLDKRKTNRCYEMEFNMSSNTLKISAFRLRPSPKGTNRRYV